MSPSERPPVVFDLDGTVWDSAPGILSCLEATLRAFGRPVPGHDELIGHLGPPLLAMLADLGIAPDDLDAARDVYRRHYREHGEFECVPYDGVTELLDDLRAAGHRTATATSKGVEAVHRMLAHFGLVERFDVVAAASMTAVGHEKSAVVAEAVRGLGPASATGWMVGDRIFDIEGGRANGLRTIGVRWGYAPAGELDAAGADAVAASVDELRALLLG